MKPDIANMTVETHIAMVKINWRPGTHLSRRKWRAICIAATVMKQHIDSILMMWDIATAGRILLGFSLIGRAFRNLRNIWPDTKNLVRRNVDSSPGNLMQELYILPYGVYVGIDLRRWLRYSMKEVDSLNISPGS